MTSDTTAGSPAIGSRLHLTGPRGQRSARLLSLIARNASISRSTIWGEARCFDGYHLALFATGARRAANRLLRETLDLIDVSANRELSGEGDKWHLGDFALHTVWRAFMEFPSDLEDDVLERVPLTLLRYPYHDGGMSENHNLLHHAMRILTGSLFAAERFADGRLGEEHADAARSLLREWADGWVREGSDEWGAALYLNVDVMALVNLLDHAPAADVASSARLVLDLIALDHALDAHAGAYSGASRRGYSCYRTAARLNPSRPLHYLWFDTDFDETIVPHFAGGVLCAALSRYEPPAATARIARSPGPLVTSARFTRRFWQPDVDIAEHYRVTTRLPGAQLSGMIIPASASRYTDFTWVASLGPDAVVFANHPSPALPTHELDDELPAMGALLDDYAAGRLVGRDEPEWVAGNVPPGWEGDLRPGFWQGHGCAPANWTGRAVTASLYSIAGSEPLCFVHLHLPVAAFESVVTDGSWIHARTPDAYLSLWSSAQAELQMRGTWAEREWRIPGPIVGIVAMIGCPQTDGTHAAFVAKTVRTAPTLDSARAELSLVQDGASVVLGQSGTNQPTPMPPRARLQTPWGALSGDPLRARAELDLLLTCVPGHAAQSTPRLDTPRPRRDHPA